MASTACLVRTFTSRLVDENASHGFSRSSEEMPPVFPRMLAFAATDQPQVCLMDQCGRLQCLPWLFLSQLRRRQFAKFVVDQRQQVPSSRRIAGFDLFQDASNIIHGRGLGKFHQTQLPLVVEIDKSHRC